MAADNFDVAIIGAGIGGLALAIGLSHLGVPFTLYESAPVFSAVGAGVGLGPNALQAMDMIDQRFRQKYMSIATGNLRPEKKHIMMEAMRLEAGLGQSEDWWGHGGWGAHYFERTGAHRKDLLEIMTSFIKRDSVRFNKRARSIMQYGHQVSITFEDGEVVHHATVVGSDGVKGLTRRVVLGDRYPECVPPQYTGKYVYRAIVPMSDAKDILGELATDAKMFMGKGANASTYPISKGTAINFVAFKKDSERWRCPDVTYEVSKEDMMNDFLRINTDNRIMKLLDHAKPTRWGLFHHLHTPTYYNSLVCLLGDVAHASGPHQGAGAGQCLEDALVLSRILGKLYRTTPKSMISNPSRLRTRLIEAAFRSYDEIRRPRAQKQVKTSQECGEVYSLSCPVYGEDIVRAIRHLNGRFAWLWEHDLAADVREAEDTFARLANEAREDTRL